MKSEGVLPVVFLPPNLAFLLKENMGAMDDRAKDIFQRSLELWPHTQGLVRFFAEFDRQLRWQKILTGMGWNNFRDRLSSIYLHHALKGRFPSTTMPELVADVVVFESKLNAYSVGGLSRAFMLGLYFKFLEIEHGLSLLKNIPEAITLALSSTRGKIVEVDLFYLLLWHFYQFSGEEKFKQLVSKSDFHYQTWYRQLNIHEQRELCTNLLHYGQAIGEKSWFTEKRV